MKNSDSDSDGILQVSAEGVLCSVTVLPRSSRCALAGIHNGSLKVKLTQPPVDGRANDECCRFMAELLGVPKSSVLVVRGAAARRKALLVQGMSRADVRERVARALQATGAGAV